MRAGVARIWAASSTMTAIALLGLALVLAILPLLGLKTYVIAGESMAGTIPKGSLILDRIVPASSLQVGDVITFRPPGAKGPVTHRIVSIVPDQNGTRVYRTKGDVNPSVDPWQVTLDQDEQPRYLANVPYVGYAIAALSLRPVRLFALALPALVIAVAVLSSLWKEAGEDLRRRETGADCNEREGLAARPAQELQET